MRDRVRIPQRYDHCTLDAYTPLNFSQARALAETRRLLTRYPAPGRDVFFAGGPGVGKTHLAVAALRELMPRLTEDALFVDFFELVLSTESTPPGSSLGRADWDRLVMSPLLVLDNFGMTTPTKERLSLVTRLLSERWRLRRPNIYTGERVRLSLLTSGAAGISCSATQAFLLELPPGFLLTFLAAVKFLSLVGSDYRKKNSTVSDLF